MTENAKNMPQTQDRSEMGGVHSAVSAKLREFYRTVQEEEIPERFLSLLERLEQAERQSRSGELVKDDAQ